MADKDNIDKALPNVDQEVALPEEETVITEDKVSEVDPESDLIKFSDHFFFDAFF